MRTIRSFNFITLNGFFAGPGGDLSWHRHGEEEAAYAEEGVKGGSILLFGRITYQMMASYWPTPMAAQALPVVAEGMNRAEKIVFSRTLAKADWKNTRIMKGDIKQEIGKLKQTPGKDMTILGSGSIVRQFAEWGLIDEYQLMIDPVVLGDGAQFMKGLRQKLDLKLTGTRTFKSGVVLLTYRAMNRPA